MTLDKHTAVTSLDGLTIARLAAQAAVDKHAEDVVVLDLRGLSTVTDFFVIGTAQSAPQLEAISDHIEQRLAQHGARVWHTEGIGASPPGVSAPQWLLMDCGECVVHMQDAPTRSLYQLERLWGDALRVPLAATAP